MTDCIFCSRKDQPAPLFQTPWLYAMPDKSPLKPGHILLISKIHLRCHADARPEALAELDEVAVKVRRFLKEAYRTESLVWENGVSGLIGISRSLTPAAGAYQQHTTRV